MKWAEKAWRFLQDDPIYAPVKAPVVVRIQEENISSVLKEVAVERERQEEKWGEQNHADGTGPGHYFLGKGLAAPATNAYLRERATEITDSHAKVGRLTYSDILLEEVFEAVAEEDQSKLREELVQVAAVTVAWIEKIDRDKARPQRKAEFLPGDLVYINVKDNFFKEYNGTHGVVTYGPDEENGWLVTASVGTLRCVADELTMITRREDR